MIFKSKQAKLALIFFTCFFAIFLTTDCCTLPGMRSTWLDDTNMNSFGTAVLAPLSIAWATPEGSLWLNRKVMIHPRFEVGLKVVINNYACSDSASPAIDGWTIILSKSFNYLGSGGGNLGYNNIYDAIVTEFDLYQNSGYNDAYSNSISVHKCINSNCQPMENSSTVQRDISVENYSVCNQMVYDLKIIYNNGDFKVLVGDTTLLEINENLGSDFDNWAYLGLSGFFQGRRRDLQIAGSYICEDDFVPTNFTYQWIIGGVWMAKNTAPTILAGSTTQLAIVMNDISNLQVPHMQNQNIFPWTLTSDISCGDQTVFTTYNEWTLITTISGCTTQGNHNFSIKTDRNNDVMNFPFTVVGNGFQELALVGYGGTTDTTEQSSTVLDNSDNFLKFDWGKVKGDFSYDDIINGLIFDISTVDQYGNLFLMGTDLSTITPKLDLSAKNSVSPITPSLKVVSSGRYRVTIPIPVSGDYYVTSSKFAQPPNRFKFVVYPGKPTTAKSICSIAGENSTPTLDSNVPVSLVCSLYDQGGNPIDAQVAKDNYGVNYGCTLDRVDAAGKKTTSTIAATIQQNGFACDYTTQYNGKYTFNPFFTIGNNAPTSIDVNMNTFYCLPQIRDIAQSQFYDEQTTSFNLVNNKKSVVLNYSLTSKVLTLIDFLDGDGTSYTLIGYPKDFDPTSIKGNFWNVHAENYKTPPRFDFYNLDDKKYVAVYIDDTTFVRRASAQYELDLSLDTSSMKAFFNYPIGPTDGLQACIHSLASNNTLFVPVGGVTSMSAQVNTDVKIGDVILQTWDVYLYNYKLADMNQLIVTVSPNNAAANAYVTEGSIDGFYNLRIFAQKADTYKVSVEYNNTKVVDNFQVQIVPLPVISNIIPSSLNDYDATQGTDFNKYIKTVFTADETPAIYFTGSDAYNNVINYIPGRNNNYLGVRFSLTVNGKNVDVTLDQTTFTFTYNSNKSAYVLTDYIKTTGTYVITLTSATKQVVTFTYSKNPGAVAVATSSGSIQNSKNLNVGNIAYVGIILADAYGNNLSVDNAYGEAAAKNLAVQATGSSSGKTITINFSFTSIAQLVMGFSSDKIETPSMYTVAATYTDSNTNQAVTIPCSDCTFNVNYDAFDLKNCKLSAILSHTVQMSQNSILQINNEVEKPIFSLSFYDSNNNPLQTVKENAKITAVVTGSNSFSQNLQPTWFENYLLWTFASDVDLTTTPAGQFTLTIANSGAPVLNYGLQFTGGASTYSDNGSPSYDLTFFSVTDIRVTAGVSYNFNIEFRTSDNLRVNTNGDLTKFTFTNSKNFDNSKFQVSGEYGVNKGDYIITVKSTVTSTTIDPIVLTIAYNNNVLKQTVNVIVDNADLSQLIIDSTMIKDKTALTLIDGKSTETYSISFEAKDQLGNSFDEIFESILFSTERIVSLFNIQHSNNGQIMAFANTDPASQKFNLAITSRTSGTLTLSSALMDKSYTIQILPGSISSDYTYGMFLTDSANFKAGNSAVFNVFPRDAYNNIITTDLLSETDYSNVDISITQPIGLAKLATPTKAKDSNNNSITFTVTLLEAGDNFFDAMVGTTSVSCASCNINVDFAPVVFSKSKLFLRQTEMKADNAANNIDMSSVPAFTLNLYDQYDNLYNYYPSDYNVTAVFAGNSADVKFCFDSTGPQLSIYVCKDITNRNNWLGLTSASGYSLTIESGKETPLVYNFNLNGGGSDANASDDDIDVQRTFFPTTQVTPIAGSAASFMIELRTAQDKRKNSWYKNPNSNITVSFSIANEKYTSDVSMGDKPGQYIVKVSSETAFTAIQKNQISITIDKVLCKTNTVLFINNPNIPVSAVFIDSKGNNIARGSLPSGTTDDKYILNAEVKDAYGNKAKLDQNSFNYQITLPTGQHVTSNMQMNPDFTFTFAINTIYSGTYTISSTLLGDPYTFSIAAGNPYAFNSLAKVPAIATAGDTIKIYVIPFDKNNNYIDPKSVKTNDFNVAYKYKDRVSGNYANYLAVNTVSIDTYTGADMSCPDGCNAFVYTVQVQYRDFNYFKVTLGTYEPIKCVNCQTDVSPGAMVFSSSSFQMYEPVSNTFEEIQDNANEDNTNFNIISRIYPRDQYLNKIDTISNVSQYSITLTSGTNTYKLKNQSSPDVTQSYVEFVKNDDSTVNGKLTYNTLPGGSYTVAFSNGTDNVSKTIVLIGTTDASKESIDEQNTVINESNLSFVAGQTGYVILELRTANNLRMSSWNQKVAVNYQIVDNNGKVVSGDAGVDKTFQANPIAGGNQGDFYVTITTQQAVSALNGNKMVLQIVVNGKTVTKLQPQVLVVPGEMSQVSVLSQYLKSGSTNALIDGDADTPMLFKVSATDTYSNPTICFPQVLKLSVIGPDNGIAAINFGKEAITGYAAYVVSNQLEGTYSVGSDSKLLSLFTFYNNNGKMVPENTAINVNDKTLTAGSKTTIAVSPMDQYQNNVPAKDVTSNFTAVVITPSGNQITADSSISGNNIIFSATLTEKGDNVWRVLIDSQPAEDILITTVTPSDAVPANSVVYCYNEGGVMTQYANGGILTRSNGNALQVNVSLRDQYFNIIDTLPSAASISSATMSGDNMTPITFTVDKSSNNDQFVLSLPDSSLTAYNHLVSSDKYSFSFTVTGASASAQLIYTVNLWSTFYDVGYGNGPYVVANTQLSNTAIKLMAASTFTFNMKLRTADDSYYAYDIDPTKDISFDILPKDTTFTFKAYKRSTNYGDYNIDIYTETSQPNSKLELTIKLMDPTTQTLKNLPVINITTLPAVPDAKKTVLTPEPESTIKSGITVTFAFKLIDQFDNVYTNYPEIANSNNLVVTNNGQVVTNTAVQLRNDGVTYEITFLPVYPPRSCSFNIYYKDSTQQVSILENPISMDIVSVAYFPNTVVLGSSLNEMPAGNSLDLSVMFYDKNNICMNNIEGIKVSASVTGPVEADISNRINYNYGFTLETASSTDASACVKSYKVNVPSNQVYTTIGTYKIVVNVGDNSYEAKSFTQKVVPAALDPTKFVSKYTMTGEFNPGRIAAGTQILFTIQGNDKFMNQVSTSFLNDFSLKLVDQAGNTAVSSSANANKYDYDLSFSQGTSGGIITASLKVYTADNYTVQYLYKSQALSVVDNSRGPLALTIVPGPCSSQNPVLDLNSLIKATTGNPASFTITCKDKYNNAITTGGESFSIMLTVTVEQTKTTTSVSTKTTDEMNGSYQVEFIPPLSGTYILTVDLRGNIYGNTQQFTIGDTVCPSTTPNKCPNDTEKCVANTVDCISNHGSCPNDKPFYCKVNKVDTCVVSQTDCDCPTGYIKCDWPNVCVPQDKDYMCSFSLPVLCKTQYPSAPVLCADGICRSNANDVPSQRVCPIGFVLCPDLTCRSSYDKCAAYPDCPDPNQIRCADQSCVLDQANCPSSITCPAPGLFVCPDGSCVPNDTYCKSLPKCIAPNSILCSDNSCVSDINNCPKQVACGNTFALCSDIICKTTCLSQTPQA